MPEQSLSQPASPVATPPNNSASDLKNNTRCNVSNAKSSLHSKPPLPTVSNQINGLIAIS